MSVEVIHEADIQAMKDEIIEKTADIKEMCRIIDSLLNINKALNDRIQVLQNDNRELRASLGEQYGDQMMSSGMILLAEHSPIRLKR